MRRPPSPAHGRSATLVLVTAVAALAVACTPPRPHPSPPMPPVPTTTAPTTTSSTTTTSTSTTTTSSTTSTTIDPQVQCQTELQQFLVSAQAGTYTSPAYLVDLSAPAPLDNPTTSGSTGTASDQTVTFTAYDEHGAAVAPTPSNPLVVDIHGAGTTFTSTTPTAEAPGADPLTLRITSGSTFSYHYDGGYLGAPVTIQAFMALGSTNVCTGTTSSTIGATTVPLAHAPTEPGTASATLPAACPGSPSTCAVDVVDTYGIRLDAAGGYAQGSPTGATPPAGTDPDPADYHRFTVDTGSLGAAMPADELGPNAIGPAGPAYKYYDSSGFEYVGFLYLAPMTFRTGAGTVTTIPIRVLGVVSSACDPACPTPPDPHAFHYLGVGFDRNTPTPASPLASPTDNALLQLAAPAGGLDYAPGYILSSSGVQVGLTSSDVAGYTTVPLTSSSVPGDWLTAPGFASITPPGDTASPQAASVLVDTGISEMFVNAPDSFHHTLADTDTVGVMVGTSPSSPALGYDFVVGPGRVPAASGMNPSSVSLLHSSSTVFVNTGRHVLFDDSYLFDARRGQVGFLPLVSPLR